MTAPTKPPMDPELRLAEIERLDQLATRMDSALRLPGTRIRIGLDSILGIIPGIGDVAALAPAAWIVNESRRLGAPRGVLIQQGVNVAIDAAIGSIPLLGDVFDVGFKANKRNVRLLRKHFETDRAEAAKDVTDGRLSSHHPGLGGRQ